MGVDDRQCGFLAQLWFNSRAITLCASFHYRSSNANEVSLASTEVLNPAGLAGGLMVQVALRALPFCSFHISNAVLVASLPVPRE
ncbi:hypothetical protein [Saccharospirillum salsuginis]|uniref:hypothetical protein n=1 Tax=Saccharospirillum salsuginis TaxID=418750 RepID=UPI00167B9F76|nr:hypothetical protein [Saccharospirillum salsuginis]